MPENAEKFSSNAAENTLLGFVAMQKDD